MMVLLGTSGVCLALVLLVFLWRRATNARLRRTFEELCRRFGLMAHFAKKVGPILHPVAMGTYRGRLTRVESTVTHIGSTPRAVTKLSVTRAASDPLELALRRNPAGRRAGETYLASGDAAFDAELSLKTNDEERGRAALDATLRSRLRECVALGMSPVGIQVAGDTVAYTHDGLLAGDRKERLAVAMIEAMHDLAERIETTGASPQNQ